MYVAQALIKKLFKNQLIKICFAIKTGFSSHNIARTKIDIYCGCRGSLRTLITGSETTFINQAADAKQPAA
jgi:hypothetical protein